MRRTHSLLTLLLILSCALAINANADNTTDHHEKHQEDLVGEIDKFALLEAPYGRWFKKNYSSYSPDKSSLEALAKTLNGIQVKVFMGTWCHDSQREVPRLYKILESSNFDLSNLSLVSLNPDKKTPNGLEEGLNVERTPTFIFLKDGVEIGRIVETPRDSLENDILKIISGQEYKHSYQD
jgi:thiol-disulfide isomerase/thioredoxin